jgi:hypothetical protein
VLAAPVTAVTDTASSTSPKAPAVVDANAGVGHRVNGGVAGEEEPVLQTLQRPDSAATPAAARDY